MIIGFNHRPRIATHLRREEQLLAVQRRVVSTIVLRNWSPAREREITGRARLGLRAPARRLIHPPPGSPPTGTRSLPELCTSRALGARQLLLISIVVLLCVLVLLLCLRALPRQLLEPLGPGVHDEAHLQQVLLQILDHRREGDGVVL